MLIYPISVSDSRESDDEDAFPVAKVLDAMHWPQLTMYFMPGILGF